MRDITWKVTSTSFAAWSETQVGEWSVMVMSDALDHRVTIACGDQTVDSDTIDARRVTITGVRAAALLRLREVIERRREADQDALRHLAEAETFKGR